ncbi:UDP-N-acetylmuramate--L-alanine ligase [Streptomyces narbonensis]|uniref:UDP-N-acetylmuramate--L-alanine ligase n=1 Tax=Streptomyces narbonensis TaxID=67333 RepID=UPI0033D02349
MCETRNLTIPPLGGPSDLSRPHLIAIGGAGMSALALLLAGRGSHVTGSDLSASTVTARVQAAGCRVHIGHDAAHLDNPSVVVWSSGIEESNPEMIAARAAGTPVVHRSHVLAQLLGDAEESVIVGGTHGKSTTTAMLATALDALAPSWAGGAALVGGLNAQQGAGSLFVAEGDESDRSISLYRPDVAVVLNVDDDHPETFADRADAIDVFAEFAGQARTLVVSADDPGARELAGRVRDRDGLRVVTFGESGGADIRVTAIEPTGTGHTVTLADLDGTAVTFTVQVPGRHTAMNAVAAFATGRVLGVPAADLTGGLGRFSGIERRMTVSGIADGVTVRESFAHHPTAIAADLGTAKALTEGRIITVFQSTGTTRTALLGEAMGRALAAADEVIILPVHATMPSPVGAVTAKSIGRAAVANGARVYPAATLEQAASLAATLARPGDLVITMGTGGVAGLGAQILARVDTATATVVA